MVLMLNGGGPRQVSATGVNMFSGGTIFPSTPPATPGTGTPPQPQLPDAIAPGASNPIRYLGPPETLSTTSPVNVGTYGTVTSTSSGGMGTSGIGGLFDNIGTSFSSLFN